MSELRTRMVRDLTVRSLAPRTHKAYLAAVIGLAKHYRRSPDQITNDEVQMYLASLAWTLREHAAPSAPAPAHFHTGTLGCPSALDADNSRALRPPVAAAPPLIPRSRAPP